MASGGVHAEQRVVQNEVTGHFDGQCQCGWTSLNWPEKVHAVERMKQHNQEHESGEPMQAMNEFEAEREVWVKK